MNLTPQSKTILIVFILVGILLMIPFMLAQSKRKKRAARFVSQNAQKAILNLFADSPSIDGTNIKDLEFVRGENLQCTLALEPGQHTITAWYSDSKQSLGKNINYSTPDPIESVIQLEAGHEYTMGMYFYPPESGKNRKGGGEESVYALTLDISGIGLLGHKNAYIICYKDK